MHNKSSGILALCGHNPNWSGPLRSVVAIQPQFHPALRRCSMMISQYFTCHAFWLLCSPQSNDKNPLSARARGRVQRVVVVGSFTDYSPSLAELACSLQAVRSPSGFETPVPSPLLRGPSFQILAQRLCFLVPHFCDVP